jgi:shikimate dehydrogenase
MSVARSSGSPVADGLTFRLLGQGIAYSASPAMMAAAFAALGLPHRYVLADVAPEDVPAMGPASAPPVPAAVARWPWQRSWMSSDMTRGQASTSSGRNRLSANTNLPATVDALGRLCPQGISHAVVLGAGGAGRAVQLALRHVGVGHISTLRRSDGSMARLADELAGADVLINATPVGTGSDESPVPAALLRPDLAVLDLVYRPSPTRLVREARAAGSPAEAGAGILLGQAIRSLELWLDRPAPVEAMRAALDAELGGRSDA